MPSMYLPPEYKHPWDTLSADETKMLRSKFLPDPRDATFPVRIIPRPENHRWVDWAMVDRCPVVQIRRYP